MTIDERVRAEDEALRTLIRDAGERAPLAGGFSTGDDGGGWAIRLPAPSGLVHEGRRVRARRRAGAVGLAAVAAVTIAVAAAGTGAGAFTLPWLRADGSTGPSTLHASSGTPVGDLVNAMDSMILIGSQDAYRAYTSGPTVTPDEGRPVDEPLVEWEEDDISVPRTTDRLLGAAPNWIEEPSGSGSRLDITLTRIEPGRRSAVLGTRHLAVLELAPGGRGQWLQVRPSAEDGWLVFGLLPPDAAAIQVRLAGSEVLLPLSNSFVQTGQCDVVDDQANEPICGKESADDIATSVNLRFATTDSRPPIDAMTYIDRHGAQVVVGTDAGRTVK